MLPSGKFTQTLAFFGLGSDEFPLKIGYVQGPTVNLPEGNAYSNQKSKIRVGATVCFLSWLKKGRCSRVFADDKTIVRWEGHKPTNTTRGHHLWYETTNWTIPP